jgi:sugar phosphate isomerase/epimerase
MRIGAPTHPRRDLVSEIEWIGRNGFSFADVFLEPDRGSAEAVDSAAVRSALDAFRLEAVGHLAWYLPIASPMPQLRRAAVEVANIYLAVFAEIGVPAVTVHAHWPPRLFSDEEGIGWQVESLRAMLDAAQQLGLRLMYEPLDGPQDTPDHIAKVLAELPSLLCHLDLGHSNLFGRSPVDMIRRFAQRLHHLHMHDNDGRSDLHLPPGAGNIEWPAVVRALKEVGYDGTVTLEVFSRDRDYLLLAKRKLETWWAGDTGR